MFEELKELELLEIDGGCQACRVFGHYRPVLCWDDLTVVLKED